MPGIGEPQEGTPRRAQYDLCVNHLVLDGYDRRGATVSGSALEDNPVFRRMIVQLKLTEPGVRIGHIRGRPGRDGTARKEVRYDKGCGG